jgi:hypothetical protein
MKPPMTPLRRFLDYHSGEHEPVGEGLATSTE